MSKRLAIIPVFMLLLLQALPVMVCAAMPEQALESCCCEGDRNCPMSDQDSSRCTESASCCASGSLAAGLPTLSNSHGGEHAELPVASPAPAPALDGDRPFQMASASAFLPALSSLPTRPKNAVPLYLRHLRLTL